MRGGQKGLSSAEAQLRRYLFRTHTYAQGQMQPNTHMHALTHSHIHIVVYLHEYTNTFILAYVLMYFKIRKVFWANVEKKNHLAVRTQVRCFELYHETKPGSPASEKVCVIRSIYTYLCSQKRPVFL